MGRSLGSAALKEIIVIIPARDEVKTIGEIVGRTRKLGYDVVVVDDASTDGTAEAAERAGAHVLTLKRQRGNLGAIQAGLTWALNQEDSYNRMVTLDADGQHAPEDIPAMLEAAQVEAAGLVIGSCPERSSWMRQMVWAFFRRLSGLKVNDMTSGFKIYTPEAASCLCSRKAARLGFQDVPTLLLLSRNGFQIKETPVNMVSRRPGTGISRVFSSWGKVAVYMAWVSWKCLLHRPRVAGLRLAAKFPQRRPVQPQKTPSARMDASVAVPPRPAD